MAVSIKTLAEQVILSESLATAYPLKYPLVPIPRNKESVLSGEGGSVRLYVFCFYHYYCFSS